MFATLKRKAKELKRLLPAMALALKHPSTPWTAKILAGITLVYALSPIDLIPDFIPVLGYLDDLIILPLLAGLTIKLVPKEIMDDCIKASVHLWDNGKPKRWYYSIPIVMIWLIIIANIIF